MANFLTAVRFVVAGDSMQPSFAREQYIMVSRMVYRRRGPCRGDVVVLRHPNQRRRNYIKRIVGLPGEYVLVEDGRVLINGRLIEEPYLNAKDGGGAAPRNDRPPGSPDPASSPAAAPPRVSEEWRLGADDYFVLGDNRDYSDDSRSFGPLDRGHIVGKAWFRYWPRSAWGIIR